MALELSPAPAVHCPATPTILQRLLLAVRAGALVLDGDGPTTDEIEAGIQARFLELTARLDQLAVASVLRRAGAQDRAG